MITSKKLTAVFTCIFLHSFFVSAQELDNSPSFGLKEGRFVGPGVDKHVTYDDKGDYGIIEGDIIVSYSTPVPLDESETDAAGSIAINGYRWPNRTLYYRFDGVTAATKDSVHHAINHIASRTGFRFVELSSPTRYHVQIRDDSVNNCSASVGYKVNQGNIDQGYQVLNIYRHGCLRLGTVVHEIMHAMGFWHEQSRDDRNSYVTVNYQNILENKVHNFKQHVSDGVDIRNYDYSSIMHYGAYYFSSNTLLPTIVPLFVGLNDIGQRSGLSDGDVIAINQIYPSSLNTFSEQSTGLTLGEKNTTTYGLNYGNNGNTKRLDVNFVAKEGKDHVFSWSAYDIDQDGDLNLYLNNVLVKSLSVTGNNLSAEEKITITWDQLKSGTNTLSFRTGTNPKDDTWGISALLITAKNGAWLPAIYLLLLDDEE